MGTQKTVVVLPGPTGPTGTIKGVNILSSFTGYTGQFAQWLQATGASGANGLLEKVYNIGPTGIKGQHKTVIVNGFSGATGATGPAFDANWFKSYQVGGINPSVVLDFVGGRYYDGTNNQAAVTSMIAGGTIDANGLNLNSTSITAIGALLTALAAKPALICVEFAGGTAAANQAIVSFGADSPVFLTSTNTARTFKATGSPTALNTTATGNWANINRICSAVVATGRNISLNGSARVSDTNIYTAPTSVQLGSFGGIDVFTGHLRSISVLSGSVSIAQESELSSPPAWAGSNALNVTGTNSVNFGNILQFERTQPWSFGAAILGLTTLGATANVICTNVATASAFPGIDYMWIDAAGKLHVRLINNITSNFIGVFGSTVLNDNKPHYLFATYDGSGLAAGVKLYVDGVPETLNIESDTLAGLSTVAAGQDLFVGNQANHTDFVVNCTIDSIRMSNIVRSPAYIAAHALPASVPAIDANTILALDFEEGTGTTTTDLSSNAFVGTLSASTLWARS